MQSCQAGYQAAFDTLMLRHQSLVYNFLLKMLGNSESASDLTQEIFFRIWKSRHRYQPVAKFTTYLYRITVNAAISENRLSRHQRWSEMDPNELEQIADSREKAPDEILQKREKETFIRKALMNLSDKLRTVLILNFYQDLSYNEIAAVLKCSVGTVKSRLARAKIALYKILQSPDAH